MVNIHYICFMIRTIVFYSILCFLAFIITYEALTQHKYDNFKVLIVLTVMGIFYYKARKDEKRAFNHTERNSSDRLRMRNNI